MDKFHDIKTKARADQCEEDAALVVGIEKQILSSGEALGVEGKFYNALTFCTNVVGAFYVPEHMIENYAGALDFQNAYDNSHYYGFYITGSYNHISSIVVNWGEGRGCGGISSLRFGGTNLVDCTLCVQYYSSESGYDAGTLDLPAMNIISLQWDSTGFYNNSPYYYVNLYNNKIQGGYDMLFVTAVSSALFNGSAGTILVDGGENCEPTTEEWNDIFTLLAQFSPWTVSANGTPNTLECTDASQESAIGTYVWDGYQLNGPNGWYIAWTGFYWIHDGGGDPTETSAFTDPSDLTESDWIGGIEWAQFSWNS